MIYFDLFWTFFKIGLFSFGGGYAMLALIQDEVVRIHGWVTNTQFTDIVAVSQVTPGPISVNAPTYIGFLTTDSITGSFWATFGVTFPSVIVTSILFVFINRFKDSPFITNAFKGLKPTVIGLILSAALVLMTPDNFIDVKSYLLFAGAFIACYKYHLSPIGLVVISGVLGIILYA